MARAAFLTTPPKLTGEIRRFCQTITPQAQPMQVKVVPFPGCDGDAFANLPVQMAGFGGQAVAGWRLAIWPRVLIHAEPHLIWHSPKDELIDVTAATDGAARSIFLPDIQAASRPHPVRAALVADGALAQWLALADAGQEGSDAALDLFLKVVRKFARPNDPCPCGSGRQMRKCHPSL